MMWFVIITSILLHLLAGFAIVILFQRISFYQTSISSMKEDLQEAYASMEVFVEEMARSNDELYEKIAKDQGIKMPLAQGNQALTMSKNGYQVPNSQATFSFQTVKQNGASEKTVSSKKPNKKEMYEQIEKLLKQGYAEEHIIKAINCTKSEVQLIKRLGTNASGAQINED